METSHQVQVAVLTFAACPLHGISMVVCRAHFCYTHLTRLSATKGNRCCFYPYFIYFYFNFLCRGLNS